MNSTFKTGISGIKGTFENRLIYIFERQLQLSNLFDSFVNVTSLFVVVNRLWHLVALDKVNHLHEVHR